MHTHPSTHRAIIAAMLGASGTLASASAADCGLSIAASPLVIRTGQTARVDVFAHFPASGYAFASSDFDVLATAPSWPAVSGGVVVGDDVLGVNAVQIHNPFGGSLADPANPLRVWSGQFSPVSDLPELITFSAIPSDFFYYPSPLTPSAAECEPDSGKGYLFVNPARLGRFGVAPGEGTSMEVAGDSVIAEPDTDEAILIGLLLPAVQKIRVGVIPDGAPDDLAVEVHVGPRPASIQSTAITEDPGTPVIERSVVRFSRLNESYAAVVDMPGAPHVRYTMTFLGKLVEEIVAPEGVAPFSVGGVPRGMEHEVGHLLGIGPRESGGILGIASEWRFEVGVIVGLSDGSVRFVDSIHAEAALPALGAGGHVRVFRGVTVSAEGADSLTLTPSVK